MVQLRDNDPIARPSSTERGDTLTALPEAGPVPNAIRRAVSDGTIGPLARKGILMGVGIARSPATHLAVRGLLSNFYFAAPDLAKSLDDRTTELVDAIEQAASFGTPADQFAEDVGKVAPELMAALLTFGVGRLAGTAAVRGTANAFPKAGFSPGVRAKAVETAKDLPVPTPRIQQIAEIVGGNVGFGAGEAILAREGGASRGESLARGGVAAGLGLGLETATRGIGKLVFRGRELRGSASFPEETQKALRQRLKDVRSEIRQTNKRITTAAGTLEQQQQLERIASGAAVIRQQVKKGAVPFVPQETQAAIRTQLDDVLRPGTVAKKRRGTERKLRTAGREKLQQTSRRQAIEDLLDPNPSLLSYAQLHPSGMNQPPAIRAMLRFWHGMFSTPEGLSPKLGPSGFKLMQLLDSANIHGLIGRARWSKRAAELRKMSNPDRQFLRDAAELYESPGGSVQAVTDRFGPTMGKLFHEIEKDLADLSKRMTAAGGQAPMTAKEMAQNKVGNFLPQVHKQVDEGSYIETGAKAMAREAGISIEAARFRMEKIASSRRIGPRRFGGIDFQRKVPGTTAAKLRAGVKLIEDPMEALFVHAQEIEHRLALSKFFGSELGVVEQLIATAGKEGADTIALRTMTEHMLGHNYHDRWMNSFARVATNWEAFTKMTYAIIPNAFQPIANNPLVFGARASAKELFIGLRKEKPVDIDIALGLMDPYLVQLQRSFEFGERRLGVTGVLANAALAPFQAMEKRWNRWFTGNLAYSQIMQILARTEAGSLRGKTLDQARRTMFDAGLDLTKIAQQGPTEWLRQNGVGGANQDELLAAIFRLTRRTQFIPTPAIRPAFWSHPFMRVGSQFMTFALNQGRLMKDIVLGEAGRGNMAPLAYVLSIHPIIGEATIGLQDFVKSRDRSFSAQRSLVVRAVEDFAAVGNFGMGHGLVLSAQFNAARRGLSAFAGPFFSDLSELVQNVAAGNVGGLVRQVTRQPVVDAAIRLYALGDFVFDELKDGILGDLGEMLSVEPEPENQDVPTLQELQRQQKDRQ